MFAGTSEDACHHHAWRDSTAALDESQAVRLPRMTLALAIIGSITGVAALILNLRREWLNRPRLAVAANPGVNKDGTATVTGMVENRGPQTITVVEVGLAW